MRRRIECFKQFSSFRHVQSVLSLERIQWLICLQWIGQFRGFQRLQPVLSLERIQWLVCINELQ